MSEQVAIVGAGILGLAHAWSASERGHQVTLFERDAAACGASIRNFGMIWPIGQPAGEMHDVALESRERWLRLAAEKATWVDRCGSIHLAHRADEWAVLEEFAAKSPELHVECKLLTAREVQDRTPAANPAGLVGGLFSSTELCVNPRAAIPRIAAWLTERFDARMLFGTVVRAVDASAAGVELTTADGTKRRFDRAVVCGGVDCRRLFPDACAASGVRLCKLQMLKTCPQDGGWRIGPHLASGLTLRHYRNFEVCPSLPKLKQRIAGETPELDQYGIHVMASQNELGEVILGDSHEYEANVDPFDKSVIDELILRELRQIVHLPDWTIAERWHGFYEKHPRQPVLEAEPLPGVHLCTATGGAGMTMSFGLAERAWRRWSA